jgi:hypothetical protein
MDYCEPHQIEPVQSRGASPQQHVDGHPTRWLPTRIRLFADYTGTTGWVVFGPDSEHDPFMKKRILATFLWFFAGWYAGAFLAEFLGVSQFLGPIIGMAAAALIAGDPRRIIWVSRPVAPATTVSQEPTLTR